MQPVSLCVFYNEKLTLQHNQAASTQYSWKQPTGKRRLKSCKKSWSKMADDVQKAGVQQSIEKFIFYTNLTIFDWETSNSTTFLWWLWLTVRLLLDTTISPPDHLAVCTGCGCTTWYCHATIWHLEWCSIVYYHVADCFTYNFKHFFTSNCINSGLLYHLQLFTV